MHASVTRASIGLAFVVLVVGAAAGQQTPIASVAAGRLHTCALDREGRAYCWGADEAGQLGAQSADNCSLNDVSAQCARTPLVVATGLRFSSIAAGDWNTCALDAGGRVYCWGRNDVHQLGVDTVTQRCIKKKPCSFAPVAVPTELRFKRLAVGSFHTCGITTDDRIACWGANHKGQLGSDSALTSCPVTENDRTIGVLTCRSAPIPLGHEVGWLEVAAWSNSTCALDADRRLYCWGRAVGGELAREISRAPRRLAAPPGVHGLALGDVRAAALSEERLPFEWGELELGRDMYTVTDSLAFPADLGNARQSGPFFATLTAGYDHRCGVTTEGEAYCWGENSKGQLGTGGTSDIRFSPRDRWRPSKVAGALHYQTISAGFSHTCALTTDAAVACWGSNEVGQLGIGPGDKLRKQPSVVVMPAALSGR